MNPRIRGFGVTLTVASALWLALVLVPRRVGGAPR
jgi:hypothetical protein